MIMPDFNSYTNNSVISNGTWIYPYPSYTTEYYNDPIVDNVIDQMIKYLPKDTTNPCFFLFIHFLLHTL